MEVTQDIANHSEESQSERDPATEALYESFGMPQQAKEEKKDVEFPTMDEPGQSPTTEGQAEAPAGDKRTFKVKYNGEEREVGEEEAPTLIQKGMNYEKVQQRANEQQQALDRVARLQGYKDHAELTVNLDKLEQDYQKQQQKVADDRIAKLRQDAEDAGLDPDQVQAYLDNHPVVQEANKALAERQAQEEERTRERANQAVTESWNELYKAYPDLAESSQSFNEGKDPEWFTPEMKAKINKGYDPKDAYELVHRDKIAAQTRKTSEQLLLKQQQLGLRGHVSDATAPSVDAASLMPIQHELASEFGVDPQAVQKQAQFLKNRR